MVSVVHINCALMDGAEIKDVIFLLPSTRLGSLIDGMSSNVIVSIHCIVHQPG